MSIDFIRPEVDELRPRISVIGVGGAGGNAIANMMRADVQGVDFVVANTDAQSLNNSTADRRIQLGLKIVHATPNRRDGIPRQRWPHMRRAEDVRESRLNKHASAAD